MSMFSGYSALGAQIGWNMGCRMRDMMQEREDMSLRQQLNYAWSVVRQKDERIENRRQAYNGLLDNYEDLRHRFNKLVDKNNARGEKIDKLERKNSALETQVRELQAQLAQSKAHESSLQAKAESYASEYHKVAVELKTAMKWRATTRKVSAIACMYNEAFNQLGREVRLQFGLLDKEAMNRIWSKAEWAPVVFANSGRDVFQERGLPLPAPFDDYDWSMKPRQEHRWIAEDLNYARPPEVRSFNVRWALESPETYDPD